MKKFFYCIISVFIIAFLHGCNETIGEYIAASSISRGGYAANPSHMLKLNGREISVWGYVDHGNMYGNDDVKKILQDWYGGKGPHQSRWRFGLKGKKNDEVGCSFSVHVANDPGRDNLLKAFLSDAKADKPTMVFIKGRVFTSDLPTNFHHLTGIYMVVKSTKDITLEHPK